MGETPGATPSRAVATPTPDAKDSDWGRLRKGWLRTLLQAKLNPSERAVFDSHVVHHDWFTGESILSEEFIAAELGISLRTVRRAHNKLRKYGLLVLIERARHWENKPSRHRLPCADADDKIITGQHDVRSDWF